MMLRMRGADYHQADDGDDEHDHLHHHVTMFALFFFIYVPSAPLDPSGNAEDALS